MVDEQRKRVEDQMTRMIEDIDKTHLRRIQGDMHKCAAVCCDNNDFSIQKLQNCIENCRAPLSDANHYVEEEVNRIQNRLQRCIMDCNDKIKDKMGTNPNQNEINKYTDEFESCATTCVDTFCDNLPLVQKTIKKSLSNSKLKKF